MSERLTSEKNLSLKGNHAMTGHATPSHSVSTETKCSRFNTDVESTLATPMRYLPKLSLASCPAKSYSRECYKGFSYMPPPWFLEAEKRKKTDPVKCHPIA